MDNFAAITVVLFMWRVFIQKMFSINIVNTGLTLLGQSCSTI